MNAMTPAALVAATNAISTPSAETTPVGVGLFYQPNEVIFAATAPDMVANGWAVFPQEVCRRPGRVNGATIKWSSEHDLKTRKPTADELDVWVNHCSTLNVAAVMGKGSGCVFCLDLDIYDTETSYDLHDRAFKKLGKTPLVRQGREPKLALFYRLREGDTLANKTYWLLDDEGKHTKNAIEVQADGKLMTVAGRHHETGNYFKWLGNGDVFGSPVTHRPEDLPEVSADDVMEFINSLSDSYALESAAAKVGAYGENGIYRAGVIPEGEVANDGRNDIMQQVVRRCMHSFDPAFWTAHDAGSDAMRAYLEQKETQVADAFAKGTPERAYRGKVKPGTPPCALTGRWAPHLLLQEIRYRLDAWKIRLIAEGRPPEDKLLKAAEKAERQDNQENVPQQPDNGLPTVHVVPGELTAAVNEGERLLRESGRGVYQRTGQLVFVGNVPVETRKKKPVSAIKIIERSEPRLAEDLAAVANWEHWDKRSQERVRTDAPQKVVATLAARVGDWTLPVLDGVITTPTIRPDGTVLSKPGYDEETGLLFLDQGVEFPEVPENPTKDEALAALGKLKHLLSTFPFVADHDRSAALSAMLTGLVRKSLYKAPMHAFTAPTPGSGKSVLVDICCILATGREAAVLAQGSGEEELEKRLSSSLMAGDSIISIDNIEKPLGGSFLNQATTQRFVMPRILGQSKTPEVLCNASFYATGNNLVLYADMVRRALLACLDPRVERPELREFGNDPIVDAKAQRADLVAAALTVIRAYMVSGEADRCAKVGSYDDWCKFVRGPLVWLGEADPWLTTERARELDPKLEAMQTIIAQWTAVLGGSRYTVADVIRFATEMVPVEGSNFGREFRYPEFREALLSVAGEGGSINSRRLGRWLLAHAGRIVHGAEIVKGGDRGGVATWSVVPQAEPAAPEATPVQAQEAEQDAAKMPFPEVAASVQRFARARHDASLPALRNGFRPLRAQPSIPAARSA